MPVLSLRPDRGCLTFSLRMRVVWRHDVFMTRVWYTKITALTHALHASYKQMRSSGDAVLTNQKLPRVASRRREVVIWRQKPFRG